VNVPSVTGRCISFIGHAVSRNEVASFMRERFPQFSHGVSDRTLVAYAISSDLAVEFDGKLFLSEEKVNV
jgi:hypothetical protein